jgi:hypothetical protein
MRDQVTGTSTGMLRITGSVGNTSLRTACQLLASACSKEHFHKGQGRQRLEPDLVPALLEPSWQLPTFPLQDTIRPRRLLGFRFNQASVMRETLSQLSSSYLRKERSSQAPLWCSWMASVTRDRVDARSVIEALRVRSLTSGEASSKREM